MSVVKDNRVWTENEGQKSVECLAPRTCRTHGRRCTPSPTGETQCTLSAGRGP